MAQCAAYEFDHSTNQCWIHEVKPDTLVPANSVDHYTRVKCTPGGGTGGMLANHRAAYVSHISSANHMATFRHTIQ